MSVSVNGGDCRFAVPPSPGTVRIHVGLTDCGESSGTTGSATSQPPVLLFSVVFGLPKLFLPWGVRQISTDSELLSVVFSSSRALHLHLHRFIMGADRSPDWFRFLSECLWRTGRHRRTGGNRLVPQPDSYPYVKLPVTVPIFIKADSSVADMEESIS